MSAPSSKTTPIKTTPMILVELVVAFGLHQILFKALVAQGTTAEELIQKSAWQESFQNVDPSSCRWAVFSKLLDDPKRYCLKPNDRLELCWPITISPQESKAKVLAHRQKNLADPTIKKI